MKKQTVTALLTMFPLLSASMALAAAVDVVGRVEGTIKGISKRTATVIYVEDAPGTITPGTRYVLDQKDKTFSPFVLPVPVGAEVVFVNSDPIMHNVHSYNGKDTIFNWGMAIQGMELKKTFEEPGDVLLLCDVHPEMEAWVKVVPTPYYTMADENGNFVLEGVPAGEYTVTAWHPRAKKPQSVTVSIPANGVAKVDFKLKK
ncbi:MAG: hypothetical protein E2P02_11275 [Acidobacteria bacterium]|nr:MAG: hypothetical protein E2P02_11275 [Acidobacteriota bacterium]